jgi:acyl carrier protein
MQDVKKMVQQFLMDNFVMGDEVDIADTTSFMKHHILDSTGFLELIGFVEDTFNLVVHDTEMVPENFDTLRNLEAYVERKLAERIAA